MLGFLTGPLECMNGSIEHVESFRVPMEGMEMQALSVGCLYMGTSCINYVWDFWPFLWSV